MVGRMGWLSEGQGSQPWWGGVGYPILLTSSYSYISTYNYSVLVLLDFACSMDRMVWYGIIGI